MERLGIVVLNYQNYQDTIECVDSLLKQDYEDLMIIIVDNASRNESIHVLGEKYRSEVKVKFIKSKENLGFAKGNNLGIKFAREKEKCEAIFVLNSDTVLLDKQVCSMMMKEINDENIGIVNPVCVGLDGNVQIPYGRFTSNLKFETFRVFFNIFSGTIQNIFGFKFSFTKNKKSYSIENLVNTGFVIQGSAYILTSDFFKYYSQLYPRTFLYGEELNLAWYLKKAGLKTVTVENARILHKEGGSTGPLGRKRALIKFKRQILSFLKSVPVFVFEYKYLSQKYN